MTPPLAVSPHTPAKADRCSRFPLSVIILTLNEEPNISRCLSHLDWCDEVILVDSGSTDDTIAVARGARPDVRVFEHAFHDFGEQRNWALDHTQPRHDWILFLDADEHCTEALAEQVRANIGSANSSVGYFLCARNMLLGSWIRHSTLYPSWQLRLLQRGCVRFQRMGHGQSEVTDGPLGYISEPYIHFGFSKGISNWVERHNGYSSAEAEYLIQLAREPLKPVDLLRSDPVVRRRCLKRFAARTGALRPFLTFVYCYLLRLGCLDGRAGLTFALLRTGHEINTYAKARELDWLQRVDATPILK